MLQSIHVQTHVCTSSLTRAKDPGYDTCKPFACCYAKTWIFLPCCCVYVGVGFIVEPCSQWRCPNRHHGLSFKCTYQDSGLQLLTGDLVDVVALYSIELYLLVSPH